MDNPRNQEISTFVYFIEKFGYGVLCPFLFWAMFLSFLIYLIYIGWPACEQFCINEFGRPRLLDISVYAWLCYYEFGSVLFLCSCVAFPMVNFRMKMLRKFGVSKKKTHIMFGFWIASMVFLQIMAWTNSVEQGTHFLCALAGFISLITAQMFDQIMVYKMPRYNNTCQKAQNFLALTLLGLTIVSWFCWIFFGWVILEWLGVVFAISAILTWIPQNLRFYNTECPVEVVVSSHEDSASFEVEYPSLSQKNIICCGCCCCWARIARNEEEEQEDISGAYVQSASTTAAEKLSTSAYLTNILET